MNWNVNRIATAFELKGLKQMPDSFVGNVSDNIVASFTLDTKGGFESIALDYLDVEERYCTLDRHDGRWFLYRGDERLASILACGLYRIGFEDAQVLAQLPELST